MLSASAKRVLTHALSNSNAATVGILSFPCSRRQWKMPSALLAHRTFFGEHYFAFRATNLRRRKPRAALPTVYARVAHGTDPIDSAMTPSSCRMVLRIMARPPFPPSSFAILICDGPFAERAHLEIQKRARTAFRARHHLRLTVLTRRQA